jgi:hypothetical protein
MEISGAGEALSDDARTDRRAVTNYELAASVFYFTLPVA